jgi:hypothetical protein
MLEPVDEISLKQKVGEKKYKIYQHCCSGCCIFWLVILFLIFSFSIWFLYWGRDVKSTSLAANAPKDFLWWQKVGFENVRYTSGKNKNREPELLALPNKLVKAVSLFFQLKNSEAIAIIKEPVADHSIDTLQVTWRKSFCDVESMIEKYKNVLTAGGWQVNYSETLEHTQGLIFNRDRQNGNWLINQVPGENQCEISQTLNYPNKSSTFLWSIEPRGRDNYFTYSSPQQVIGYSWKVLDK